MVTGQVQFDVLSVRRIFTFSGWSQSSSTRFLREENRALVQVFAGSAGVLETSSRFGFRDIFLQRSFLGLICLVTLVHVRVVGSYLFQPCELNDIILLVLERSYASWSAVFFIFLGDLF